MSVSELDNSVRHIPAPVSAFSTSSDHTKHQQLHTHFAEDDEQEDEDEEELSIATYVHLYV
jgi:hypothetical protein